MGTPVKQLRTVAALVIAWSILGTPVIHAAHGASSRRKTVLVLGDSVAMFGHVNPRQVYPALLEEKLRRSGLKFEVINESENLGNTITTARDLARLACNLRREGDIFIIELAQVMGIDPLETLLQNIIDQVKACQPQARIIICGMRPPDLPDDFLNRLSAMYSGLAEKNHVALVPDTLEGVAGDPNLTILDGLHPNAAGHRIVAENIWRVLEPIAREVAAE
jgi:acyl-CoA thioesterase-1